VGQAKDSPSIPKSILIRDLSIPLIEESRSFVNVVMSKEDFMFLASDYTPLAYDKRTYGCGMKLDPFSSKFINTDSFFPFLLLGMTKRFVDGRLIVS
jgi:hypothetical protein